jgi:hypothetical protein
MPQAQKTERPNREITLKGRAGIERLWWLFDRSAQPHPQGHERNQQKPSDRGHRKPYSAWADLEGMSVFERAECRVWGVSDD